MPPDPTPPLPLAADRAALSNRISMLLASQSSVLKTMNLARSAPAETQRRRRAPLPDDDSDDMLRGLRPNEGVGYVPEAKDAGKTVNPREERMLRGGKGRAAQDGRRVAKEESESEDDVGRSALGKRKRPRREVPAEEEGGGIPVAGEEEEADAENKVDGDGETNRDAPTAKEVEMDGSPNREQSGDGNKKRKKNKKKKKKKKKQAAAGTQE